MRQIFTSTRVENVQTVEQLLHDAGIDTKLTDARSWNRATKRDFSYADRRANFRWPAVWVIKAEDFARARDVLREHGVELPTTRLGEKSSYVPDTAAPVPVVATPAPVAKRIRYVLLAVVAVMAVITVARMSGLL
jgi:hypothetical protein